ncbi:MAG: cyclase family protein [Clostridia bacterium]|nr:cyclase family protein [Clostridia bacterium]
MKPTFWDISRELLTAPLYPGDPAPKTQPLADMRMGDECNTTALSACLHTGTHLDAPRHFLPDGDTIDELPLSACCGKCYVVEAKGPITGEQIEKIMWLMPQRILFKGDVQLTQSAAFALTDAEVKLVGVEGPSVASPDQTGEIHRQLLSQNVLILEGLDLSEIKPGQYILFAAPIKIAGADGAPVRAFLTVDHDLAL